MVIQMVTDEDEDGAAVVVVVDEQGRMVLPARLRQKLGIKKGGRVSIRSEDSHRVIIERRRDEEVEDRVRKWVQVALGEKGTIAGKVGGGGEKPVSTKWMSSEYARRKLGL